MAEHPALTERQREVVCAVVQTGSIKGSASMVGITETSAHHRMTYARQRCGCGSVLEMIWRHHDEIVDGAISGTTARALVG